MNKYRGKLIGSEGCVFKLEKDLEILLNRKEYIREEIRILTPPIPLFWVNTVYTKIQKLTLVSKVKMVFNDFGMLYKCKQLIEEEKIIPVLGRVLTKSFSDCPWFEKLIRYESIQVQKMMRGNTFEDTNKLVFLKEFKIREIEVNANNSINKRYFNHIGILLTTYFENHLLAIQRECPILRIKNTYFPKCYERGVCSITYIGNIKIRQNNLCDSGDFFVFINENAIYRKIENIDYEKYNTVIC